MPKLYVTRYCVRCGKSMKVCKPTFVCETCPVKFEDILPKDKSFFYDYHWGTKIENKTK